MGVWIEIKTEFYTYVSNDVTPCVGVWIEMRKRLMKFTNFAVTPCVGVWIEICLIDADRKPRRSLPAWECGLK